MKRCHACRSEWVSEKKQPSVKEPCDKCGAYLHCCLNCRFYDEHAHNKCRIPTTDWVGDRAGCNFCDEFTFAATGQAAGDGGKKAEARGKFNQIFGDDVEGDASPGKGREALDKLFGD